MTTAHPCRRLGLIDLSKIEEQLNELRADPDAQAANAAVAVVLKPLENDIHVLLVKRIVNRFDPWSGQMALPGGKRNTTDQDLQQTVVRETLEETKIDLLYRSRFLGVMLPLPSTKRPELTVLPFVFLLEHEPVIKLNELELDGFVWVSLNALFRHTRTVKLSLGEFPAYVIDKVVVWGLTYRILKTFEILGRKR